MSAYKISGPDVYKDNQILLLFDYSLRLAPSAILGGCRDFTDPMYLHHSE